jgi:hypothetical protein
MMSSDGFGGGAAGARPRVQVRPTPGAESGTIVPAQQQITRHRERQLFPNDGCEIDARWSGWQRVELGVLRRLGIAREHGGADIDVYLFEHLGETPATLAPDHPVQATSPEEFSLARCLQLTVDQDVTNQVKIESLECRITGAERPFRAYGTALQVPNIHSQHSLLR